MPISNDVLSQTILAISDEVTFALSQTVPFLSYSRQLGKIHSFGGEISGGSYKLRIPIEVAENSLTTDLVTGFEAIDMTHRDNTAYAEYAWGRKVRPIAISNKERAENSGPSAVVDLAQTRLRSSTSGLMRQVSNQIIVGGQTGMTDIGTLNGTTAGPAVNTGFLQNLAPGSQTSTNVGGLSKATYQNVPGWQNQYFTVVASGGSSTFATLGLKGLRQMRTKASLNREASVDDKSFHLIIASAACHDLYEAAATVNQRFVNTKELDAGNFVLTFEGCPIVADPALTLANASVANTNISAYLLNLDDHRFI